jgi:hypothetical protein
MATPMTHRIGNSTWKMVTTEAFQLVVVVLAIVPMAIGPRMATSKKLTAMTTTSRIPNPNFFHLTLT